MILYMQVLNFLDVSGYNSDHIFKDFKDQISIEVFSWTELAMMNEWYECSELYQNILSIIKVKVTRS